MTTTISTDPQFIYQPELHEKTVTLSKDLSYRVTGYLARYLSPSVKDVVILEFVQNNKTRTTFFQRYAGFGGLKFWGSDDAYAYFSVTPDGLGGYYLYPIIFNLYRLNLEQGSIDTIFEKPFGALGIDIHNHMAVFYHRHASIFFLYNLKTGEIQSFPYERPRDGNNISPLLFSPDFKKIAFAIAYGPDSVKGEVYIYDFASRKATLYTQREGVHLTVERWISSSELEIGELEY